LGFEKMGLTIAQPLSPSQCLTLRARTVLFWQGIGISFPGDSDQTQRKDLKTVTVEVSEQNTLSKPFQLSF
jgi:hypothetical protein